MVTSTTRCRRPQEALDDLFRAFPSWFLRIANGVSSRPVRRIVLRAG
jgi:hypothetical protein